LGLDLKLLHSLIITTTNNSNNNNNNLYFNVLTQQLQEPVRQSEQGNKTKKIKAEQNNTYTK
jgi:hypothetical protein